MHCVLCLLLTAPWVVLLSVNVENFRFFQILKYTNSIKNIKAGQYQRSGISPVTVNPEMFARISFSRVAVKDILATGKFRD